MCLSLDKEIRMKLASYLLDKISLEEFEEWFSYASWNVNNSGNKAAINMVYEIELWLSEYSDGFKSESEIKRLLRPLVENYIIKDEASSNIQFSSTSLQNYWLKSAASFRILHSKTL